MSHDACEKEKLPALIELTKALEIEQMCLLNKNREIANYAHSSKPKKTKSSEQREKRDTKKIPTMKGMRKGKR